MLFPKFATIPITNFVINKRTKSFLFNLTFVNKSLTNTIECVEFHKPLENFRENSLRKYIEGSLYQTEKQARKRSETAAYLV